MPLLRREPVEAIRKSTLRMILEASKDMEPREFGAILRAEGRTITELMLLPGTVSGERHAIFQLHMLPIDFSVVGTVHSHPSGVPFPSEEDLHLFSKFGYVHIIVGAPYDGNSWRAWSLRGDSYPLRVIED